MFYLILWWTIGVVIRFLLIAVQQSFYNASFNLKVSSVNAAIAIVVGAVAAYFVTKANMQHWIFYALFLCAGFLTKYIIEKLDKIKG